MTKQAFATVDQDSLTTVTGGMNLDNFRPSNNVIDHRTDAGRAKKNVDWTPTPHAARAGF